MAENGVTSVRIDRDHLAEVYAQHPELAGAPLGQLIRAALLFLAGRPLPEAVEGSKGNKRGPAPKANRERESAGVAA